MSLESDVKSAVAFTGLECATGEYGGPAKTYLVLSCATMPAAFADDEPTCERQLIALHLHCPAEQNTVALRRSIKRAIFAAGYTYPSMTDVSDKSGQHVVFEFEGVEDI